MMTTEQAPTTDYINASNQDGRPPVIVLGTVVEEPKKGALVPTTFQVPDGLFVHVPINPEDFKREPNPRRCNDVVWATLFIIHLGIMVGVAATFIPQMTNKLGGDYAADAHNDQRSLLVRLRFLEDYNSDDNGGGSGWSYHDVSYQGFDSNIIRLDMGLSLTFVAGSCVSGILLATMALGVMILFAETLIRLGFIVAILLALLGGVAALATVQIAAAILSLVLFVLLIWYATKVWSRIPFAATNLVTATTIVRDNLGVAFYAYFSLFLAFGWAIFWTSATIACLFMMGDCSGDGSCSNDIDPFIVFLFLASYHWTFQVIANVVTVTVAGVSGTWWMVPVEGKTFCSRAVTDSYYRANTLAFGSVCLGSLIVAIVSAAKDIIRQMRESGDNMLVCCAEFCMACMERFIEYFNEWAFCFVGIYGYSFVESGMEVMNLLKSRGWTSIIADDLTGRALLVVAFCVAIFNGFVGLLIGNFVTMGEGVPLIIPFLIALITGFTLCSTLFSVVGSACKSVIVLYAEAPNEFQANHPELSHRMRNSWHQAWPMDFKY